MNRTTFLSRLSLDALYSEQATGEYELCHADLSAAGRAQIHDWLTAVADEIRTRSAQEVQRAA